MIVLQDEVNEKVVSLCIRGGKISAQILKASLQKLLRKMEQSQKRRISWETEHGKTESTQSGAF